MYGNKNNISKNSNTMSNIINEMFFSFWVLHMHM